MNSKIDKTFKQPNFKPNVLHLLKYSLPNLSGYSIRSHYILLKQKRFAHSFALINPYLFRKNKPDIFDNVIYFRYPLNLKINSYRSSLFSKYFMISRLEHMIYYSLLKTPLPYIKMIVKQKNVNLIHGHTNENFAKFGEIVAHKRGIPFVYEVRGFWEDSQVAAGRLKGDGFQYLKMRKNESTLMKKSDAIITLGKMMKLELISRGIDQNKIIIIPNAVDIENFQPKSPDINLQRDLSIEKKKVIAYIGSIREIEGIETLIKAIVLVRKEIKDVVLLLIGSCNKTYLLKLEKLVKKLGIDRIVHFTGQIQQKEIKKYYSIVDVIVIPRNNFRVTRLVTPLKQLEAMAMQKVVITSDLPALCETIKPGISGDIFKTGDSSSLANKILYYLSNQDLRRRIGETARKFVQKNYDWNIIIEKYHSLYKKLLE